MVFSCRSLLPPLRRNKIQMTEEQIKKAADIYPRAVTGPMAGCNHPGEVLRWALTCSNHSCRKLAENFIISHHGSCWNAMIEVMPANGWLVWYTGTQAAP
jgi:hypothetical protein